MYKLIIYSIYDFGYCELKKHVGDQAAIGEKEVNLSGG
jgi:hypothetical protein